MAIGLGLVSAVPACSDNSQTAKRDTPAAGPTTAAPATPADGGNGSSPATAPPALPAEYRIAISADLRVAELTALIARAAARAGASFAPSGESKCRLVELLDTGEPKNWLASQGFSLRLRERLDESCESPKKTLAMSFNRRIDDRQRADSESELLAPARELSTGRTRRRLKHITAISQNPRVSFYWVGGTVRKLRKRPESLAELAELFPGVRQLPGYNAEARLQAVGGLCVEERNFEIGTLTKGGREIPVELAVWRPWRGDGKPLISELLYPRGNGPSADKLAEAIARELAPHTHRAKTRHELLYQLAGKLPEGSASGRCARVAK